MKIEVEIGEELLEQVRHATRSVLAGDVISHLEDYLESCAADPNREIKSEVWKDTFRTWLEKTYGERAAEIGIENNPNT